ncbi:MAG: heat-inducible transcription repressor HrcA [Deltaproteobacteria bacterium]|nr:heat-inducible transcription repressor HrcA [Deltaproteobacteria bacterium]
MVRPDPKASPLVTPGTDLDERARRVLSAVVQDHIGDGAPVGSVAIAKRPELEVSSATVRAVMADLEALGYLEKPHTSAGRVPTPRGYRYYVDALLHLQAPKAQEKELIEKRAQESQDQGAMGMIAETTRLLHSMTRHASVLTLPRADTDRIARIEFVSLREGRVLVVLVTRSGAVQNRLLAPVAGQRPLSPSELTQGMNWLNQLLGDLTLSEARARLDQELLRDRALLQETQARALALGAQAVHVSEGGPEVRIEGQSSLLEEPAWFADVTKVRALFRALEEKQGVVDVLDRVQRAQGLTIFIGKESGIAGEDISVVAAPYRGAGDVVGALGVLGPTRMDYARVIPLVEFTARTVGLALGGALGGDP